MIIRTLLVATVLLTSCPAASQDSSTAKTSTENPSAAVKQDLPSAIAAVLAKHNSIDRAYLIRNPESNQVVLVPIFVDEYDGKPLAEAMAVFAELAPDQPPLSLMLLAKRTWKKQMAGIDPIYVRP